MHIDCSVHSLHVIPNIHHCVVQCCNVSILTFDYTKISHEQFVMVWFIDRVKSCGLSYNDSMMKNALLVRFSSGG
jgi:hypothetical protein